MEEIKLANETVTANKETEVSETKQYTNDDVMIILNAMPDEQKDLLLNSFDFNALRMMLSKDYYKASMEAIDYRIKYYTMLKSAVERLYIGINMTDTEENKIDTIMKLYNKLDDEKKVKVASEMQKTDNLNVSLGKFCDTWKSASEKFKNILPKLDEK